MKTYIGTKVVNAKPMTRLEYNELRVWTLPENENPNDEGYLVENTDGGLPNHTAFSGYISWSPKKQFEDTYRFTSILSFGLAIEVLKTGAKVARAGWNGKGMWLMLVNYSVFFANQTEEHAHYHLHNVGISGLPWIGMKTADDMFVPWLASQTDILAEDWQIVA